MTQKERRNEAEMAVRLAAVRCAEAGYPVFAAQLRQMAWLIEEGLPRD